MSRRFATPAQFDAGVVLPANAGTGKVLTSDASGNGGWAPITASIPGGGNLYSGMGPPPENTGALGDYWLDTTGGLLYGPKGTQVSSPLNLHPNPSVEDPTGIGGWGGSVSSGGPALISERTQDWAAHGVWSYHRSIGRIPAANCLNPQTGTASGTVNTTRCAVDPAKRYSCQITQRIRSIVAAAPQIRVYFYWFQASGAASAVAATSANAYEAVASGEQRRFIWLNIAPPSDAAFCVPSLYGSTVDAWDADTDGVIFVEGATLPIEWPATGTPINLQGIAGGDLSGSYPNPQIGAGVIVNADVNAAAAIAESKLALASDAAAGTASRRTLGTGALQAAAGTDARLSDARAPTAHASTHKLAGADAIRLDELAKPTALVDLNNQLIDNLAGLKIPPGAGAGKLLVSDASGNGTWGAAATPANVASSAAANNNVSTASAATWALIPGSAITIPETGRYFISTGPVTSQKPNNTNAVDARIVIFRNGAAFSREAVATYADAFAAMPLSITGYYDLVAGDVLDLRYSTNNQVNSFGASSLSAYRQLAQGPTGPKGDPGSTEYAFISGGGGTATPMAGAGSWIALPVGQATPRTNVPAGAFTLNANGSVTVRDGGVYKVEASTLGSAVWTTNAVRAAVGVGVGATAVAAGANLFARNDATTVGTADSPSSNVSGTMELAAGDTVWIVGFTATSAGSLQVSYFSLSRVAAGPQGPQGAQGPAGTLGVSTVYPMGALPAVGSTGQIVLFAVDIAAGAGGQATYSDIWMAVWRADIGTAGAWQVLGHGFPLTATTDPTDLAAGTGWRKPTGTPSVECPYAGSYEVDAYCEANYSALTGCAVGPAISTVAATGTPPASGGASAYLTNVAVATRTPPGARLFTTNPKVTAADVTYDLRVWNAVSSTILFVRATLNVRPVYVYGVA